MGSTIENDEFLQQYLVEEAKADMIQHFGVSEQIKKLSEGIGIISTELHDHINLKHKDLLSQASCSHTLELELTTIRSHVQSLHSGAEKIKRSISEPYLSLESETFLLERLHEACHILRHIALMQYLTKELDKTTNQIMQARIINDLSDLVQDPTVADIEIVLANVRHIHLKRQQLSKLAKAQFTQALISENKEQISSAVQILTNLEILNKVIEDFVSGMIKDDSDVIKTILSQSDAVASTNRNKIVPGGVTKSNPTLISKDKLWACLDQLFMDKLFIQCRQIKLLEGILLDVNNSHQYSDLASSFWNTVMDRVSSEMKKSSPLFQAIFEEDYPRILRLYSDLSRKLNSKDFISRHSMVLAWENVYLAKSISRLLDPINEMFRDPSATPSHENIDSLIRIITGDLSVALIEESLSDAIAKNVVKSIRSFVLKTENIILNTAETCYSNGVTNVSQQFNVQLANSGYYFKVQLLRMLTNMNNTLPQSTCQIIKESLENFDQVMTTIIAPLVVSINSTVETIINTIHLEPDWNKLAVPAVKQFVNCSPYMRELLEYLDRAYKVHLSPFNASEALSASCAKIAVRCIDLFVRHSSLVRPINAAGRLRLQSDYRELENGLCNLCPHLQTLGRPYRLLKSMATLIVLQPSEVVKSQLVGSSVPHSTLLLLLFSHASENLQSPHETTGWSLERLSMWFDEHAEEKERLELITGALNNYVTKVRKLNIATYDPVYVLMASLLN